MLTKHRRDLPCKVQDPMSRNPMSRLFPEQKQRLLPECSVSEGVWLYAGARTKAMLQRVRICKMAAALLVTNLTYAAVMAATSGVWPPNNRSFSAAKRTPQIGMQMRARMIIALCHTRPTRS